MKDLQFPQGQVNQKNLHKTPSLSELQLPSQYTKELKKKNTSISKLWQP